MVNNVNNNGVRACVNSDCDLIPRTQNNFGRGTSYDVQTLSETLFRSTWPSLDFSGIDPIPGSDQFGFNDQGQHDGVRSYMTLNPAVYFG